MPEILLRLPASLWAFEVVPFLRIKDLLSLRGVTRQLMGFFTLEVAPVLKQLYMEELEAFGNLQPTEEQVAAREMVKLCRNKLAKVPEALMYVKTYTENVHECIHMAMAMFCCILQPSPSLYPMKDVKRILKTRQAKISDRFYRAFLRPAGQRSLEQLRSLQTWTLGDVLVSCDMAGLLMELVELFFQFQNYMRSAGEDAQAYIRRSENCRQFEKCLHKLQGLSMPVFRRSSSSFRGRPPTPSSPLHS